MIRDIEKAEAAKTAAIDSVETHAPEEWLDAAYAVGYSFAVEGRTFIAEDIMERVGWLPPEPRAMGAVIRSLALNGYIQPTGRYIMGSRPCSHRRPQREWVKTP